MTGEKLNIVQGEYAVGTTQDAVISTLLGSCVACCLWDAKAGIGGMNHMLLARGRGSSTLETLADINSIEKLINAIVKLGASRDNLQAKAFGGASMVSGLSDVGQQNAEFTLNYLKSEGIDIVTHSLGGQNARNIRFWPATGRVMQRVSEVKPPEPELVAEEPQGNGMELF